MSPHETPRRAECVSPEMQSNHCVSGLSPCLDFLYSHYYGIISSTAKVAAHLSRGRRGVSKSKQSKSRISSEFTDENYAFITAANAVRLQLVSQETPIRHLSKVELEEGQSVVVVNAFKYQSAAIDRLTSHMSSVRACTYVRTKLREALSLNARSFHVDANDTTEELLMLVNIHRVFWESDMPYRKRRFFAVVSGTWVKSI